MSETNHDCTAVALSFAQHLANRSYESAYALTTQQYQADVALEQMQEEFEEIIPEDWGEVAPIEVGETMQSWPQQQASDLMWLYVSLGGDVYSEAVTVVVALEDDQPRIRTVEFGRP